jgi:DnaD/phage-associated family protein
MTWAKFDDVCPEHPKVAGLSDAAHRLWFNAVCYSTKMNTDGRIKAPILARLYPRRPLVLAEQLVTAGLWHEVADGWDIHDFLTYQPARADVLKKRAEDSERKRRGNASESRKILPVPSRPVPKPDPVLKQDPDAAAAFAALENLVGTVPLPVMNAFIAELKDAPEGWIVAACEEAALSNGRSWKYVEAILKNWRENGFKARKPDAAHTRSSQGHPTTGNGRSVRRTSDFD